jgi:FKBP-type peptidyl-prolyl cis-trans isomerase
LNRRPGAARTRLLRRRALFALTAGTVIARFRVPVLLALFLGTLLAAPAARAVPRAEFPRQDEEIINKKWPEAVSTPSGLRYIQLKEGNGARPLPRQRLSVLYRGMLLNGTEFSASVDPEKPFVFTLGTRRVIAGWEEAFPDMRVGEKRLLIIPYALAYGLLGRPPDIPNRATLVFEVELLAIE